MNIGAEASPGEVAVPLWLVVFLVPAVFGAFVLVAVVSYIRDLRRGSAWERWAARNGWSFAPVGDGGPSWARWSVAMVNAEVARMLPNAQLSALTVGPVLSGVVDNAPVSVAAVRWIQRVDSEGGLLDPFASSLLAACPAPAIAGSLCLQRQPGPRPVEGDLFDDRFRVLPDDARGMIPEALQRAHLAGDVSPWSVSDGRLMTVNRHQRYQWVPSVDLVMPAARQAVRIVELLSGQP